MIELAGLGGLDALGWARIAVRAAGYAAALTAAGSALFLAALRPDPATARATRRLAAASAALGALLCAGVVFGEALFLVGGDPAAALDPFLLGVVADSPLGAQQALRAAGLASVAALAFGSAGKWPALAGAAAVAASFAVAGHSLREPRAVLGVAIALHVAAAAFWIGAFAPLARAARQAPLHEAGRLAGDFGRAALITTAVLVVVGAVLLTLIGGSPVAALGAPWGRLLALKLLMVAALLGLAALNRLRLTPGLVAGRANAAQALRRSISLEAALVGVVLVATAAMTVIGAPPAAAD